jgi:serine/threonine protein kinase
MFPLRVPDNFEVLMMVQFFHDYQSITQLGKRSSSSVHLARSLSDPDADPVVIKIFNAINLEQEPEQEHFLQEVDYLKQLHHPHIIEVVGGGIERGHPYLVSTYAVRGSLRSQLDANGGAPLPLGRAIQVITEVGQALSYAHAWNILHARLKPENVLFGSNNEVMLADFMLESLVQGSTADTRPDLRTACYMAPEQFVHPYENGNVSEASDQYALGCLAYEVLTGTPPFTAAAFSTWELKHTSEEPAPLRVHNAALPTQVEAAVLKALAKDPADRHASVEAFMEALSVATVSLSIAAEETIILPSSSAPKSILKRWNPFRRRAMVLLPGAEMAQAVMQTIRRKMERSIWTGLLIVSLVVLGAGLIAQIAFARHVSADAHPVSSRVTPSATTTTLMVIEPTMPVTPTPVPPTPTPVPPTPTPVPFIPTPTSPPVLPTPTPTSAVTLVPTATSTPVMGPASTPTVTPTPQPTLVPTATPQPTLTPTATPQPQPTATPTPKPKQHSTSTATPTPTPKYGQSPSVEASPTAVSTVEPTPTATPTVNLSPTVVPTIELSPVSTCPAC